VRDEIDLASGFRVLERAELVGEPARRLEDGTLGVARVVAGSIGRVREVRDLFGSVAERSDRQRRRRPSRCQAAVDPRDDHDPVIGSAFAVGGRRVGGTRRSLFDPLADAARGGGVQRERLGGDAPARLEHIGCDAHRGSRRV
jgi:hypothetical protein